MELTARVRRFALARPHVLLLQRAGGTRVRLLVERWAREQGWPLASSPVDADVVAVCGDAGPTLAPLVERILDRVPAPRAVRYLTVDAGGIASELLAARDELWDWPAQRRLAAVEHADESVDQATTDHSGMDHEADGGMDHEADGGMDHGADGGTDHMGHMDMAMEAAGLPLAERAQDRDGLKLDVLHVPLGPFLVAWPAGLTLRLVVQGDVVQAAEVEGAFEDRGGPGSWWDEPWRRSRRGDAVTVAEAERRRAAAHLDSLGRLLVVAGADGDARTAARLRDAALGAVDVAALHAGAARLRRRVERSRLLRRATRDVGVLEAAEAEAAGVTGPALRAAGVPRDLRAGSAAYPGFIPVVGDGAADVYGRCRQWLGEIALSLTLAADGDVLLDPRSAGEGTRGGLGGGTALARVLPELVTGQELLGTRLVVASLDPDGDDLAVAARAEHEVVRA